MPVDPGEHVFRFDVAGEVEQRVLKQHFVVTDIAGAVAIASRGAAGYLFFARPVQATPVSLTFGPHHLGVDYARTF